VVFSEFSLNILNFVLSAAFISVAFRLGDDHERVSRLSDGSPHNLFPGDNIGIGGVGLKNDLQVEDFSFSIVEFQINAGAGDKEVFEFLFSQRFEEVLSDVLFNGEVGEPELENIGKSGLLDHTGSEVSGGLESLETGLGLKVTDLGGDVGLEHSEDGLQTFNGTGKFVEVSCLSESNESKDNEGTSKLSH